MKNRFIALLGLVLFIACKRREEQQQLFQRKDQIRVQDKAPVHSAAVPELYTSDTIIEMHNEEVVELDNKLKKISATEYKDIDSLNKPRCDLDSNGFVKNLGFTIKSSCDEVCDTYLVEKKSGKKILLPTDFDTGLLGVRVSPPCDQFLTYSSYDMPDYNKYYPHRALIILYNLRKGIGLNGVKCNKTLGFKLWSIMEVKWIDEKSIALKLYKEENSNETRFTYFKVKVE